MSIKACNFCGQSGLHWENFGNKWKLYDSKGNIHTCSKRVNPQDKRVNKPLNFHNDPLINKALAEYKKKLEKSGAKVYRLTDRKFEKRRPS